MDWTEKQFLPLEGTRVLDLTRALSGPFCAMILGDLGADVVKIEATPDGDLIRAWGPFDRGESVYYLSTNHNKRSVAVNFRSPEGLALLRDLALKSDIVVENFRPGTMAEIGLDPVELQRQKPALIVASLNGFGGSGPLSGRPGFDQIAQGYSGFMSVTGPEGGSPTRVGIPIGDLTSGMWLAIGVLSALVGRQTHGRGQILETSLFSSLVGLLGVQGQRYLSLGEVAKPNGNDHPVIAPYGAFSTQDGDLNIAAGTQKMWLQLCDVLGLPDLKTDPRFSDNANRVASRSVLRGLLEARLRTRTRAEWTAELVAAEIPAGPINNIGDVFAEPQAVHNALVEEIDHPSLGALKQIALPLKIAGHTANWVRRPPPRFGDHTTEVLAEFNFSVQEIKELLRVGAVVQRNSTSK